MNPHIQLTIDLVVHRIAALQDLLKGLHDLGGWEDDSPLHVEQPTAPAPLTLERGTATVRKPRALRAATGGMLKLPRKTRSAPGGGESMISKIRTWCAAHPEGITPGAMSNALGITPKAASDRLIQLMLKGECHRVERGVFAWGKGGQAGPARAAGEFVVPRPKSGHLETAVLAAAAMLPPTWTRDDLEAKLSAEDRALGRKDGNLAGILTTLREQGRIDLVSRDGGLVTYRTVR